MNWGYLGLEKQGTSKPHAVLRELPAGEILECRVWELMLERGKKGLVGHTLATPRVLDFEVSLYGVFSTIT